MDWFKKHLAVVIFLFVAMLGLIMAGFAFFASERANQLKFEGLAEDALGRIEARIELHLSLLNAAHAFFEARLGRVDRASFRTFVASLDTETQYAGIQGLGYASLISTGSESESELSILANYAVERAIWPASEQAWRVPIIFLEPLDKRNLAALGFDMFAETRRREAILRSVGTGLPQASARVELVQEIDGEKQAGFLVYVPLLKNNVERRGDDLALEDVAGFAYAPFRADDLFNSALLRSPVLPVHVEAFDDELGAEGHLYTSQDTVLAPYAEDYRVERKISVAGRVWNFRFSPTEAFSPSFSKLISLLLGVVSLLLAAALALSARSQTRALGAIAMLHEASEKNLSEREMMLQEMKHRIKNSIARVLAIARQTAAGSESLAEFNESFAARLQAMSRSQDMLTRSKWQRAELRALLTSELQQVFGEEFNEDRVKGPDIELNETTTQALGLTVHELATNALKYGAVGADGRGLGITWRLSRSDGASRLDLDWIESDGDGVCEPQSTGFGTKLIDANIIHELSGSIERDYQSDGLKIRIRIPLS